MRVKLFFILTISLLLLSPSMMAKNLGVMGAVYPIAEPDLMQVLQARMVRMEQDGSLQKFQNDAIKKQMDRPQPVAGLTRTVEEKSWLFNPAVTIPYDLKNAQGQMIAPAGTTINPLDTISLSETLIFYNADDPDQVRWVKEKLKSIKGSIKLILVGGSVLDQMKILNRKIYFDQQGLLTKRFGLHQVPVVITQQGNRLKIEEVQP